MNTTMKNKPDLIPLLAWALLLAALWMLCQEFTHIQLQ